jgi:hypothetical protein
MKISSNLLLIFIIGFSNQTLSANEIVSRWINRLDGEVARVQLDQRSCERSLKSVYRFIWESNPDDMVTPELAGEASSIIQRLWDMRNSLRGKWAQRVAHGPVSESCVISLRNTFRALRATEDYLGHYAVDKGWDPSGHRYAELPWGFGPETLLAPGIKRAQLRSGDLLLSRGNAYVSAAIARLGDTDTQFSHLAMIYIEEKTGKIYTIESHIELGVVVAPYEIYFKDGKARSAIFRYPDASIAHNAARFMYELVKRRQDAGNIIPYDFNMDPGEHDTIFCSEVAGYGFDFATHGELRVPLFPSSFRPKNRDLLDRLGVHVERSFLPADLEVDPRFDLIGEWRDYHGIQDATYKDAVLTRMYSWMDEMNYRLSPSNGMKRKAAILYLLRHTPGANITIEKRFPLNMPKKVLETIFALEEVSGILQKRLESADRQQKEAKGNSLSLPGYYQLLDTYRASDFITTQRHGLNKSDFHALFHP